MTRSLFLLASVVVVAGCFDGAVAVAPLSVTCASSAECPSGNVCLESIGRCVPVEGRDQDPPSVSAELLTPKRVRPGDDVRVQLIVDEELFSSPTLAWQGGDDLVVVDDGAEDVEFVGVAPDDDGDHGLVAVVVDRGGNVAEAVVEHVVVDGTAPTVVDVSVTDIVAPPGCLRDDVSALGVGGSVVVRVVFDEPVTRRAVFDPVVGMTVDEVGADSAVRSFTVSIDERAEASFLSLKATVFDDVGNSAHVTLPTDVVVDADRPDAAPVDVDRAVVWRRAPHGAPGAPQPAFSVELARFVPVDGVFFVTSADAAGAVLGRSVDQRADLVPFDADRVSVTVVDDAGNASDAVLVRDVEFVVGFGGADNENVVSAVPDLGLARTGNGEFVVDGDGLAADDGVTVDVAGAGDVFVDVTPKGLDGEGVLRAAATDASRGRVVVFGGASLAPELRLLGDTHEWDGARWRAVEGDGPTPRAGHALVWDPRRGVTVLTGGMNDVGTLADTWEFDGARWTLVDQAHPAPRIGAAVAFTGKRVVQFGGIGDVVDRARELLDRVAPPGEGEGEGEEGEGEGDVAEDCFDDSPIATELFNADLYAYSAGGGWVHVDVADDPVNGHPSARVGHALVHLAGRTFLFGGVSDLRFGFDFLCGIASVTAVFPTDTWELIDDDGLRWRKVADDGPPGRALFTAVADPVRNRLVVGGGARFGVDPDSDQPLSIEVLGDGWIFDPTNDTWSQGPDLDVRVAAASAFDLNGDGVLHVGGLSQADGAAFSFGFATTSVLWRGLALARSDVDARIPFPDRKGGRAVGVVTDDGAATAVVFGGNIDPGGFDYPETLKQADNDAADTWFIDDDGVCSSDASVLLGESCLGGTPGPSGIDAATNLPRPPPRDGHALAFDELRHKVVVVGGGGFLEGSDADVWEFDVDDVTGNGAWSRLIEAVPALPAGPGGRLGAGLAFDGARVLLFGGCVAPCTGAGQAKNDLWALDPVNAVWELVDDGSGSAPAPRFDGGFARDVDRGVVVAALGNGGDLLSSDRQGDTWSWDGAGWTRDDVFGAIVDDDGAFVRFSGPEPRTSFGFAADPAHGRLLLFGGRSDVRVHDDLWAFVDGAWQLLAARGPPSREQTSLAVVDDAAFLIGGSSNGLRLGDVWRLGRASGRPELRFDIDLGAAGFGDDAVSAHAVSFAVDVDAAEDVTVAAFAPAVPGWVDVGDNAPAGEFVADGGASLAVAVYADDDVSVDRAAVTLVGRYPN